jgi:YbbR domain-containing protein
VRNVEVTFNGLRVGWRATAEPRVVDVELQGPPTILSARITEVQAIADLEALEAGSHRVKLRVRVPSGVTAWQATPPAVQVSLTRP